MFIHILCNIGYVHQIQKVLGSEKKDKTVSAVWLSCSTHYNLFQFPEQEITVLATSSKNDPTCKI
jgi:hypothetical protein